MKINLYSFLYKFYHFFNPICHGVFLAYQPRGGVDSALPPITDTVGVRILFFQNKYRVKYVWTIDSSSENTSDALL